MKLNEKLLLNIMDSLPVHVYWTDKDLRLAGCNSKQAENFGVTVEEALGKTMSDFGRLFNWDLAFIETINKIHTDVMLTKKEHISECSQIMLDGQEHTFLSYNCPLLDEYTNKVIGVAGISVDITDRKKMEAALKQAKHQEEELRNSVTMFAGSIVHDLRTPLATQNMQMGLLKTKIEKMLHACKQSNMQIENITTQLEKLLEFPQYVEKVTQEMNVYITDTLKALEKTISGVKTADDLVRCSLWKCLQKAIKSYPCLEEDRQKIHWDRSVNFDFMGNPISFYRIISNLLKNAFEQICQYGQGEIYLRAQKTEHFNQLLIKDTAGYVTEETIKQLFKGYKSTKKEGTGVGLVFCKSVMESFGGDINCQLVDDDKIEFSLNFLPLKMTTTELGSMDYLQ